MMQQFLLPSIFPHLNNLEKNRTEIIVTETDNLAQSKTLIFKHLECNNLYSASKFL